MATNIKATNMEMTEAIKSYLNKKLEKLNKFTRGKDDDAVQIDVEVGKSTMHHRAGDIFKAEINILMNGEKFRSVAETADLYGSIDEAEEEIMNALRKSKTKKTNLFRRGGQRIKDMIRGWRGE